MSKSSKNLRTLEEGLRNGRQLEVLRVELVQLEEGQVGLQVVGARVPRLHLHVALKGLGQDSIENISTFVYA